MSELAAPVPHPAAGERADLDRIERELRDVETTLARLADGTFWSEPEVLVPGTGAPDPDAPDH
jgi:hypothetical protein